MITRDITTELLQCATEYPVVTILGPRQSGKTTLAKMAFSERRYFSLEDPDIRAIAEEDPRGFLDNAGSNCILDEVQRVPHLLSYIQGIVDQENIKGQFILTGSHQPRLHEAISQSLAGRTAMLSLWPFSFSELRNYKDSWSPFELMWKGTYPGLHQEGIEPRRFYNNYLQTYLERDVRLLAGLRNLSQFQSLLTLLAGRVGQVVNLSSLSNDVGVSSTTIREWLNVLKATYVIFELPPYFKNIRKRVIKSSKIYFTDVGVASYLLGIHNEEQAMRDPLRGNLYENIIISDIFKSAYNKGIRPEFYFFRDSLGCEVDLLIKEFGKIIPVEIKSAKTFSTSFLKGIKRFRKIHSGRTENGIILYTGDQEYNIESHRVINPLQVNDIWDEVTRDNHLSRE
ncbi:ATP-binding protein [bacterium]|jgi:uncharacterized protein|nr:ATP-binding protein [bacterium]MBT4291216.1 ATP-binding protein [bacterium]MBT7311666.1 ATP-binding protein [bacterium]